MTTHHQGAHDGAHRTPAQRKKWIEDRPTRIAVISGFFSTLITVLNALLKK
jgi:hypothetical protein